MSSVFLVVEPSKIMFLIQDTIPQKEDIILLYIGYHRIPKILLIWGYNRITEKDMEITITGLYTGYYAGLGFTCVP